MLLFNLLLISSITFYLSSLEFFEHLAKILPLWWLVLLFNDVVIKELPLHSGLTRHLVVNKFVDIVRLQGQGLIELAVNSVVYLPTLFYLFDRLAFRACK